MAMCERALSTGRRAPGVGSAGRQTFARAVLACVLLVLPLLISPSVWAGEVSIALREQAQVDRPLVTLGDVATVTGNDAAQVARWQGLELAPTPPFPAELRVTSELVRSRLLATGENLVHCSFTGRAVSVVTGPGSAQSSTPVRGPRLVIAPSDKRPSGSIDSARRTVEAAVQQQFRTVDADQLPLEVSIEGDASAIARLSHANPTTLRFPFEEVSLGGPQTWILQTGANDPDPVIVQATVRETAQLLTVRRSLSKGQTITAADVTAMPAGDQVGLARLDEVVGRVATRTLRPGQPIAASDVASVVMVRNQDIVTVRVKYPGLVVKRPFKAQGEGRLGEEIVLVSLDDPRKTVQARVTGYHEAELAPLPATESTPTSGAPRELLSAGAVDASDTRPERQARTR